MKLSKFFGLDRSVIFLFTFSILGSAVNYAFQIFLGNMLTISDYGKFNTINAFSSNLMCFYSPLAVYACRVTAERQTNLFVNRLIYKSIVSFALLISAVVMVLGAGAFLLIPLERFGIDLFSFWMLVLVMTVTAGIYVVINGILQGIGRLEWYGFLGFCLMIIKMGLSYMGVKFGGRVPTVVWAMLISYAVLICLIVAMISRTSKYQYRDCRIQMQPAAGNREMLCLYGLTFLVQMVISLYINGGETMLMSYFYDNEAVGRYSLAANVAKISMYIVSIFASALLPKVSSDWGKGKAVKRWFYIVAAFAFGIGIVWVLFLSTIGRQLSLMFLGERYYEALSNVKYMALWIIGLGMLLVANTFYLAINRLERYLVVLVSVTGGIVGCVAISGMEITYVPTVIGVGIQIIILFVFIDMRGITNPNNIKKEYFD